MTDRQRLNTLCKHIRTIMARDGLTQYQVAERAGVSAVDVSRILAGVNPRWTKGAKIMELTSKGK